MDNKRIVTRLFEVPYVCIQNLCISLHQTLFKFREAVQRSYEYRITALSVAIGRIPRTVTLFLPTHNEANHVMLMRYFYGSMNVLYTCINNLLYAFPHALLLFYIGQIRVMWRWLGEYMNTALAILCDFAYTTTGKI